ncbi:MAG: MFS transporter [Paludibacteraceae bacterium]
MTQLDKHRILPWLWVPTLYFVEGIPYFLVNEISVLMFTKMGVPNGQMALFTSLLYLPWVIKPFWSPFIDIIKTKRWWIVAMQLCISAILIVLALTLPHPDAHAIATTQTSISLFSLTLVLFIITAFASATHDVAADGFYMLALSQKQQSAFVGIRSMFYRLSNIFGNGLLVMLAGFLEQRDGIDVPTAWQWTLGITALCFTLLALYHNFAVPHPAADKPHLAQHDARSPRLIIKEFARTFVTFFAKKGVWLAILFMLLYRLPEAFLLKMCKPFLLAAREAGGLAMHTADVGLAYGTVGVIALTVGGILGGLYASHVGLRKALWPMAACMTLPCLTFVYLSICRPTSLILISAAIAIEQFGYGFGFTAYMLYMMYFSEGEFKTTHYALCTAFMALSMMIPGMVAGYLQEWLGYINFFWLVMVCCVATVGVTIIARRHVTANYGCR